jgi:hypothetical protein
MHKIIYMTIVLTLSFGLLLETVGSDNATTAEQFENITHGGGPGAGATNQSER